MWGKYEKVHHLCKNSSAALIRECFAERGFVVLRVGARAEAALRLATRCGGEYFQNTPGEAKRRATRTFADAGGLALVGYNQPRARPGCLGRARARMRPV